MRNRITIQTTEELEQALEETRVATGRQTKSEVIRDSLELYDLIVQHLVAGKHLYLGMTRESAGEVLLPHLEQAAGRLRPQLASMRADVDVVAPLAVRRQTADSLNHAFALQREFMDMLVEHDRLPEYPVDLTTKPGQRLIKETAFNQIAELMEATVILKNKMHRLSDATELDFPHFLEELGDAWAFFMEICILAGITPEMIFREFVRKNSVVRKRLAEGY